MSSEIRIVIADDHPIFRAGLKQTIEASPRFKVVGAAKNSPAVGAGIAIGDEIMAIDDKPANQYTSGQIEKMLMQDGTEFSLTLRRAGKEHVVRIKLRRLI